MMVAREKYSNLNTNILHIYAKICNNVYIIHFSFVHISHFHLTGQRKSYNYQIWARADFFFIRASANFEESSRQRI